MSRAARNSKVLRAGAIGFVAGLATLGVVAHASPAHVLIAGALGETTPSANGLAAGKLRARHAQQTQSQAQPQSQDPWLLPQDQSQQQDVQPQDPSQQYAQPQYQQPQQQYVQPAPSQQPQSQAS